MKNPKKYRQFMALRRDIPDCGPQRTPVSGYAVSLPSLPGVPFFVYRDSSGCWSCCEESTGLRLNPGGDFTKSAAIKAAENMAKSKGISRIKKAIKFELSLIASLPPSAPQNAVHGNATAG